MKVTLALGLHASLFLSNPTKAAGGSSKFLGWADNVEMLTTANLSRVSDLRTTAGDREHESNGFQLFPTRLWQRNEHTYLEDLVSACGQFEYF